MSGLNGLTQRELEEGIRARLRAVGLTIEDMPQYEGAGISAALDGMASLATAFGDSPTGKPALAETLRFVADALDAERGHAYLCRSCWASVETSRYADGERVTMPHPEGMRASGRICNGSGRSPIGA